MINELAVDPILFDKVSIAVPADEWLCKKFEDMNLIVMHGYAIWSGDSDGLHVDQFLRVPKSQVC